MAKKSQANRNDSKKLNPDIKKVDIGVREVRTINVYPLSISDQFQFAEYVSNVFNELQGGEYDLNNLTDEKTAIDFIQNFIGKHIMELIDFVVDENEKPTFDELTNNQLAKIATIIFEENFEGLVKNFKNLFERAKGLIQTQS